MSLSSDMQTLLSENETLVLENARLQVQVEKAKNEKLVAALEDAVTALEDEKAKVAALEDEKRLSVRKSDKQALQPAHPSSSSDHALRAENAQLRTMIAQRDEDISALVGMVGGLDKEVRQFITGLVKVSGDLESNRTEMFDKAPERLSLLIPHILRGSTTEIAVNEHEPRTESKASASVTKIDDTKEPSNPPPAGFPPELPLRPLTQFQPATPLKFPRDSASNQTAPSQLSYVQALQTPRAAQQPRGRGQPGAKKSKNPKKEAQRQGTSQTERQPQSEKPNKSRGTGGPNRGRTTLGSTSGSISTTGPTSHDKGARSVGYAGPQSTQVTAPAKTETPKKSEVTSAAEGMKQPPKPKPQVGSSVATSSNNNASNQLRGGADAFVPKSKPAAVPDTREVLSAEEFAGCERWGWPTGKTSDDYRIAGPPLDATPQSTKAVEAGPVSINGKVPIPLPQSPKQSNTLIQQTEPRDLGGKPVTQSRATKPVRAMSPDQPGITFPTVKSTEPRLEETRFSLGQYKTPSMARSAHEPLPDFAPIKDSGNGSSLKRISSSGPSTVFQSMTSTAPSLPVGFQFKIPDSNLGQEKPQSDWHPFENMEISDDILEGEDLGFPSEVDDDVSDVVSVSKQLDEGVSLKRDRFRWADEPEPLTSKQVVVSNSKGAVANSR